VFVLEIFCVKRQALCNFPWGLRRDLRHLFMYYDTVNQTAPQHLSSGQLPIPLEMLNLIVILLSFSTSYLNLRQNKTLK